MKKEKKKSVSCAKGCSIGCLGSLLLFCLFIFTMCHVPKSEYEPYLSSGGNYYKTVLGITPEITHDTMYADEGGGFGINVSFTKAQSEKNLTKLYMRNTGDESTYWFRGTSTEPNIVGLSEKETQLLRKSNEYSEFNRPVSELLDELLEDDGADPELSSITNEVSIDIYSTDLDFWKNVLANYEQLKAQPFSQRLNWLRCQTNEETYFYITKYVPLENLSAGMLHNLIQGEEDSTVELLTGRVFSEKIVQTFPVGSIYELRMDSQQYRNLYESDEKNELIDSRYEYPVTY